MALPHAASGDIISVRPLGPAWADARTHALFKSEQLEVMRLVLRTGEAFPAHEVPGEITLHCLEGEIEVSVWPDEPAAPRGAGPAATGQLQRLHAGEMLFLRGGVRHGVRAVRDASALVTIVLSAPAS